MLLFLQQESSIFSNQLIIHLTILFFSYVIVYNFLFTCVFNAFDATKTFHQHDKYK